MSLSLDQFKCIQRSAWSSGDQAALDAHVEEAAADIVHRLDVSPGMRVLDIATGTGNAAIMAAKAGADVIGLDLAPELFDDAEARADALGLSIRWREGDAEALPYPNGVFDRVVSTFGVMYAPRHREAARELVRVLRPGGRFGLVTWLPEGIAGVIFDTFQHYLPTPPAWAVPPQRWGDPEHVRALFADLGVELSFDRGSVHTMFASPEDCMRYMEEVAGPVIAVKAMLRRLGRWSAARAHMIAELETMVHPDIGGCWTPAGYLVVVGHRVA